MWTNWLSRHFWEVDIVQVRVLVSRLINKQMVTNEECEIISIKGKLEGLNNYYLSLSKISKDPTYRGDLTEELKRVETEINLNKQKLMSYGK